MYTDLHRQLTPISVVVTSMSASAGVATSTMRALSNSRDAAIISLKHISSNEQHRTRTSDNCVPRRMACCPQGTSGEGEGTHPVAGPSERGAARITLGRD